MKFPGLKTKYSKKYNLRLLPGLTFVKVCFTGLQCDSEVFQYVIKDVNNPKSQTMASASISHGLLRARSLSSWGPWKIRI